MPNQTMKYVAYYRVSTQQQGRSGLGLEAQQSAVKAVAPELLAEYTDIESGKNSQRPELLKAIEQCRTTGATLIVAKLDRLSRNLVFIGQLMESKIKFVCCDMPEANEFTIHIFAALAEQERKMISTRTKAALKAAKARGIRLGGPNTGKDHCANMRSKRRPKEYNRSVLFVIEQMRSQGESFKQIAVELNKQGFKTDRGNEYSDVQVMRVWNKQSKTIHLSE